MGQGQTRSSDETAAESRSATTPTPAPLLQLTVMLRERRVMATLLGIIAFLLLAGLLCVVAGFTPAFFGRDLFVGLFNLSGESNIPTAFSVLLLLLATLILGVIAGFRRQPRSADNFSWKALTVIFGGLALEEATSLHGRIISMIRESTGLDGALPYAWVMADGMLILIVLFAVLHLLDHLPATVRWRLTMGSVVYVCGALGVEMLGSMGMIPLAEADLLSRLMPAAGEGIEMLRVVLFIGGLPGFNRLYLPELKLPISLGPSATKEGLRGNG